MDTLKRGDKFQITFTSQFGKEITQTISVVAINGNSILMDNGQTYHKFQLV